MKIKGSERPGQPQLPESILNLHSFPFTKLAMGSKGIKVQVNIASFSQTFKEGKRKTRCPAAARLPGEQGWLGQMRLLHLTFTLLAVGGGGDATRSNVMAAPEESG